MAKTSAPTPTKASRCPPRSEARSQKTPTRWTTRLMPFFLLGVIGFACWALTGPICSESSPRRPDVIGRMQKLIQIDLFS